MNRAKKTAIYVRVSSEEQVDGYSLDAQVRAIENYCQLCELEVVAHYRDEGKSARTDNLTKRPAFSRMIADAEYGRFDVIVVHKLDRFARNLRVTLETLDRLERAGVGFMSVSENMDFSTPMGRVVLSTMGSLAQFYSDNLSTETKKGKRERKAQGIYNGLLPFGVAKGDDGVPVESSDTHAGLVLAFELAAAGQTDLEVARALNAAGYRTTGNRGANPFTKDSVRPMLQNRFYLGELPDGDGGWVSGKHAPMIGADLFARAQGTRLRNGSRPRRTQTAARSPWALSGIATCVCGHSMTAYGNAGGKQRVQCSHRTQTKECDAPTFYADIVEDQIADYLRGFAVEPAERRRLVSAWKRHQGRTTNTGAERANLERKLARVRELYLDDAIGQDDYRARKVDLTDRLAALPIDGASPAPDAGERLAAYLADIALAWQVATPEERNRLARQLFNRVVIDNRTAVAVTPRPDLLPFFAAMTGDPSSLVTHGRKRRGSLARDRGRSATSCAYPLSRARTAVA